LREIIVLGAFFPPRTFFMHNDGKAEMDGNLLSCIAQREIKNFVE
jgi:hypothetical protein